MSTQTLSLHFQPHDLEAPDDSSKSSAESHENLPTSNHLDLSSTDSPGSHIPHPPTMSTPRPDRDLQQTHHADGDLSPKPESDLDAKDHQHQSARGCSPDCRNAPDAMSVGQGSSTSMEPRISAGSNNTGNIAVAFANDRISIPDKPSYEEHSMHSTFMGTCPGAEGRHVPTSVGQSLEMDSDWSEVCGSNVRLLLDMLAVDNFEDISTSIIYWANRSEHEKDGRTLLQVIRLVFEKATDGSNRTEIYARLCQKMLAEISPNVRDERVADENCTGGRLFRKYLLNRCQEDFERCWNAKVPIWEGQTVKRNKTKDGDDDFSDEWCAVWKAKRQGVIKFLGELYKLHMFRERIMHECIKKLLTNLDDPEEEDIESLCKLLEIVGQTLDEQDHAVMDVFFSRIRTLSKSEKVLSRMTFALLDVIELRQRKWVPRIVQYPAPMTIAQVYETAARDKVQEREDLHRSMNMSSGGPRINLDSSDCVAVGPDGRVVADASGPTRSPAKAGGLANVRKINKVAPGQMIFGPNSVFSKDSNRESATPSQTNSSSNMFQPPAQVNTQTPTTPPTNIPQPLPSARFHSCASTFIPGQKSRTIGITDSSGHGVNFGKEHPQALTGAASPSPPPIMSLDELYDHRQSISIEDEEMLQEPAAGEAKAVKWQMDAKANKGKQKAEVGETHKAREEKEKEKKEKEEEAEVARETEEEKECLRLKAKASVKPQCSTTTAREKPATSAPESNKKWPIHGPLDFSSANNRPSLPLSLPSVLATARPLRDLQQISYPEGILRPKAELNVNARDGKFRYDRDFLLQFMEVCTEKPDNLPPLDLFGLEPEVQNRPTRGGSGRLATSAAMPPTSGKGRSAATGLGLFTGGGSRFSGNTAVAFSMCQFSTPGKLSSEQRFMHSTSMGTTHGRMSSPLDPHSSMVQFPSQGGPNGVRDVACNDSKRVDSSAFAGLSENMQPLAPLEATAARWVSMSAKRSQAVDNDSPEVVDGKVRALLNKLTMDQFEAISKQIIDWVNKSEHEKDGRTLLQVSRLIYESATNNSDYSEIYARLCQRMLTEISPNVRDERVADENCTGGRLFRKYLFNRCQEDFERGWQVKELITGDQTGKGKMAKDDEKVGANVLDQYYAAQKAKRQGLGLVRFIGELYKLHMLRKRIMHECIKKLLNNIDDPEEEEIESLCKLLTTVGKTLDEQNSAVMDVFFSRITTFSKSDKVTSRIKFVLLDVLELRQRRWVPRIAQNAALMTIAPVHEAAAREKAQKEREDMHRSMNMSRGGLRRGMDRSDSAVAGPYGWAFEYDSGSARPAARAGELSHFGEIDMAAPGQMTFGPSSVFSKDSKRESAALSRTNSSSHMFHMLSQGGEGSPAPLSTRRSLTSSRTTSDALTPATAAEASTSWPSPNLLPRLKQPLRTELADAGPESSASSEVNSEDGFEIVLSSTPPSSTVEQAGKKIDEDVKKFFNVRMLDEAELYFIMLPSAHHHLLVNRLVLHAIESKVADARLVGDLFERCVRKRLCSPTSFEKGFTPIADALDDIIIDAPKAFTFMALILKSTRMDYERQSRIAGKFGDGEELLELLAWISSLSV